MGKPLIARATTERKRKAQRQPGWARKPKVTDRSREARREIVIIRRGHAVARIVPARQGGRRRGVERDAIVDKIAAFAKTVKIKRRFNFRKLIEEGRK